jgi:hypoxanthine phosphoribosyltransferase
MDRRYLNWNDIDRAINRIIASINSSEIKINAVGGLPRGGLIPAVMLSHRLGIPFVSQAQIQTTIGNILIVDDICDSGKTLKRFKFEENIYTATLHWKQSSEYQPNYFWEIAYENEWIVYPWENRDSKTIPDYATKGE